MSITSWLERQSDREANGDNAVGRQLWPRGQYRNGWNLEAHAAFSIHHWAFGPDFEKDQNDIALGFHLGPLWLGLHGFRVSR